ncbi:AIPR family protein [Lysobacter sp. CA199]|uniref:AIPR family protein n=1 Tax=Lysobacter sp. CA199 TaxID=3455608 RepID=UPI003F8D844D
MATNDVLLLDGVIDDLLQQGVGSTRGEAFELFALTQLLKEWDLSQDEIRAGWVDGRQDGGIDGFYVIVNGHCLIDVSDFVWPKGNAEIVLHLVTCKHASTFSQAAIDALIASFSELLDLSISEQSLKGAYSEHVLVCRARLLQAYRRLAPRLTSFQVAVSYASRGDSSNGIGTEVRARASQIQDVLARHFDSATIRFEFIGSTELISLHRKRPKFSLSLPFVASLNNDGTYVLLANLADYYEFCSDEGGKLRRYLFDSNVRDFMGLNRVNQDIATTLADDGSPNFWWLNNGVTILAISAFVTNSTLHMENVQVVNGLQTTESIFRHFASQDRQTIRHDRRSVMVKVIVTEDVVARDRIILATNNQSAVEQVSLRATDKVQRDIEEALRGSGIYYERRKNYYVNQGVAASDIVGPMYLAAGILALVQREPWTAVALRQKSLRSEQFYQGLFSDRLPLTVCSPIVRLLKLADSILELSRPPSSSDRFLVKNRYILAYMSLARHLGTFDYATADLALVVFDNRLADLVRETWRVIPERVMKSGWRSKSAVKDLCRQFASDYELGGLRRVLGTDDRVSRPRRDTRPPQISSQFKEDVFNALPRQPWKPGTHIDVCRQLGCSPAELFSAVDLLVEDGLLLRQRDGVLYELDGSVAGCDPERVTLDDNGNHVLKSF